MKKIILAMIVIILPLTVVISLIESNTLVITYNENISGLSNTKKSLNSQMEAEITKNRLLLELSDNLPKGEKTKVNFDREAKDSIINSLKRYLVTAESDEIVTDPLVYSNYFGGSFFDFCEDIAIDSQNNIWITGYTYSEDLPITNNASNKNLNGKIDIFIIKIANDGRLLYCSYFGGSGTDYGYALVVDNHDNIWLSGLTCSNDFPITADAFQKDFNGVEDAFIVKLNSTGQILYSSYFGGSDSDTGKKMVIDNQGNIWLMGITYSNDFPITANASQKNNNGYQDAFVIKLNASGDLLYGSFLGGSSGESGNDIAIDSKDNVWLVGTTYSNDFPTTADAYQDEYCTFGDAFIVKFNNSGQLQYSTYLGGSNQDIGYGLATDNQDNIWLVGATGSIDLLVTFDAYQKNLDGDMEVLLVKFDNSGQLLYCSYFGGSGTDNGYDVITNGQGSVYIVGHTYSNDFPVTEDAYKSVKYGESDIFILGVNDNGQLVYCSYLGGSGSDWVSRILIDDYNNIWLAGESMSHAFLLANGTFKVVNNDDYEIFVIKLLDIGDDDDDSMLNYWERQMGLNATDATDASADNDGDWVSNLDEYYGGTDPNNDLSVPWDRFNLWYFVGIVISSTIGVIGIVIIILKHKGKMHF